MSKNIFATLKLMDFNVIQAQCHGAALAFPQTPVAGQKRTIPDDFKKENSQPSRNNPMSAVGSSTLPSLSSMNATTTVRQYLTSRKASVGDMEEVMKLMNVSYLYISTFSFLLTKQEPALV